MNNKPLDRSGHARHSAKGNGKWAIRACMTLLLVLAILWPAGGFAYAAEREVVRVAYFDLADYYRLDDGGAMKSYDAAYLAMVSEYTNLDFTYVDCGTWDRALEMLEAHEIDLVGTMQWTQERENKYEICDASYGYTVAELAALPESDFIYEDYSRIAGSTVGCVEGYVVYERLHELMAEKRISFAVKTYPDQKALTNALYSGEIDLLAANAHAMNNEWKVIEKFAYAPYYFASWRGNGALTDKISDAIIRINIHQDSFDDNLIEEYFPRMVNSPYTKEEMNCVNAGVTYQIYLDDDASPLSWYDEDTGAMRGILIDVCGLIAEKTGLKLEMLPRSSRVQNNPDVVDYFLYHKGYDATADKEPGRTSSICDEEFLLYYKAGDTFPLDKTKTYRVALTDNREGCRAYLSSRYSDYKADIVSYASPTDCIRHLKAGDVDFAFLSSYAANRFIVLEDLSDITALPVSSAPFGIGLLFRGENAETLANIIDKGYRLIGENELQNIILTHVTYTTPKATLTYFIRHNLPAAVMVVGVILLLVLFAAGGLFYAKTINEKNRKIRAAEQARMDFFSRMSHDMRTPMNGILGMIDLTTQSTQLSEVRENMAKAKAAGVYLLSLINDTLDLQRLENGKLQFNLQIVSEKAIVGDLIEMVRPTVEQKGIRLSLRKVNTELDGYVLIDPVRVKQIFVNILSNAIKFTPSGGSIAIELERLRMDGMRSHMRISISDTGIGMSEDFIHSNLYKPYSQEYNAMTEHYAGTGLGLAITKNLVDLMGGRLEVKSEVGAGTTFTVFLEFERVEADEAASSLKLEGEKQAVNQTALLGKRVLICEDQSLNAEIAKRLLKNVGCESAIAENGQAGVELFSDSEAYAFDAILMDIRMPVMGGLDATRAIRALSRADAQTVPIIAMTANAFDMDIQKCMDAGMNEHLPKPIDPETLYETIARNIAASNERQPRNTQEPR